LGSSEETYLQVLHSFVDNTAPLLEQLADGGWQNTLQLQDYAIVVHGIKGSSRNIGAEAIGELAEKLEEAAKHDDQQFVEANNQTLVAQTRTLLTATSEVLAVLCGEFEKPLKDSPDQATLKDLQKASAAYSMDGIDTAMDELESYDYNQNGGLVIWLRQQVDCLGFTAINDRLATEL
jgi:HPt (histidine-containing phosphotransfer) domain-containing protein